jgi:hypothetical protein
VVVVVVISTHYGSSLSQQRRQQKRLFRKSCLLSWDGKVELGQCIEERVIVENDNGKQTETHFTVRIRPTIDDDDEKSDDNNNSDLTLEFPGKTGTGLASEFWPVSLATSILLRSNEFRSIADNMNIVELGTGRGLAGLVAAEHSKSCLLTDNDEEAMEVLSTVTCPANQGTLKATLKTQQLDWRGIDSVEVPVVDFVLGSDIAYYFHLLRPLMDTSRAFLESNKNESKHSNDGDYPPTLFVAGQANRESLWDLYKNIKNGCYNQLTDEHDQPWPGTTRMLLYNLQMSSFCESLDETDNNIDGDVPVSVIIHHDVDDVPENFILTPFSKHAHLATEEDDENIMKSF